MLSIREQLNKLADEEYRKFSSSLTPGINNIIGVRLPLLRKLAKEIAKSNWQEYIKHATADTFEELMLQGMVIGYIKADIEDILNLVKDFIPLIDNWALCDSFCSGLKIAKSHKKRVWDFIQPYLYSDREFEIRFSIVMILNYFVDPEYASHVFSHFDRIKHEGYYVKMAVAWAISVYYVAHPNLTLEYIRNNNLDKFTHNKALQKIRESMRVDQASKKMIGSLKKL